jgi:hypothetical protein
MCAINPFALSVPFQSLHLNHKCIGFHNDAASKQIQSVFFFFFLVIYLFLWYADHVLHSFNMVGEFDGFLKGVVLFNLELSYALFQGCNLAGGGNSV